MARKKKVVETVVTTTTDELTPEQLVELQTAAVDVIIETTGLLHGLFQALQMNNELVRAALKGSLEGYLKFCIQEKLIQVFNVTCDATNNFEDDEIPFVEIAVGFDKDNLEDYVSFAMGSDEAIEEWDEAIEAEVE